MKITKRLRRMAMMAIAITISISVQAQPKAITGKVTCEGGVPLPGVTVSVKNKTNASTTTNGSGDFSIMASSGDVLLFSSVGYTDLEERVGSGNSLNISMAYSATNMNEVVVVGYGTQRKKDVTGA